MSADTAALDAKVHKVICEYARGGVMTYVIRNIINRGEGSAPILRACKRLEKRGLIKRVPSAFAVMICWAAVEDLAGAA